MDERAAKRERLVAEAFGDGVPEERRREAQAALARFDAQPVPSDPAPSVPLRHRRILPTALIAGVVGLALGIGGTLALTHSATTAAAPSATSTVTPEAPVQAADALLAEPRSTTDALPSLEVADSRLRADTSHLVFTSAQGERLYIASASSVNIGYCLVAVQDAHAFGGAEGTVRCAPIRAFARDGITYPSAGYSAHWVGGRVEITVTGQG